MPIHLTCTACGKPMVKPPSKAHQQHCSIRCAKTKPRGPIEFSEDGLTARIPLRARDESIRAYAIVDAADAERVNQWRWSLDSDGYAVRTEYVGPGKSVRLFRLHCELMGVRRDVDHIDGVRLNCRRQNLRIVPKGGNAQNRRNNAGSSSAHRGVGWSKGKWEARIWHSGKLHYLGRYASEEEAAAVARAARLEHMPYATD